jgi:hypothetical protein
MEDKHMLIIHLPESDLSFFEKIIEENKELIDLSHIRGFDGTALAQIIIDSYVAVSTSVLTALGLYLTYRANKKSEENQDKELELKEKELIATEEKFKIRVSNGKQTITYTNSDLNNLDTDSIIESISNILKQS